MKIVIYFKERYIFQYGNSLIWRNRYFRLNTIFYLFTFVTKYKIKLTSNVSPIWDAHCFDNLKRERTRLKCTTNLNEMNDAIFSRFILVLETRISILQKFRFISCQKPIFNITSLRYIRRYFSVWHVNQIDQIFSFHFYFSCSVVYTFSNGVCNFT